MIRQIFRTISIAIGFFVIPTIIIIVFLLHLMRDFNDNNTLFVQKIIGSDLSIVDYDVWYGRDGNSKGQTILKTTKNFDFRKVDKLPFNYFENISAKEINGISLIKPKDYKKIYKNKKRSIDNLDITTSFYRKNENSKLYLLNVIEFNSFTETTDSLFFFELNNKSGVNSKTTSEIGFKKGNIKLQSDSLKNIYRIEILKIQIDENQNIINNKTKNGIVKFENLPLAHQEIYYLKPTMTLNENDFSDFGIFKEIK